MHRHPHSNPIGPGQESVWDFPRPARIAPNSRRLTVEFGGRIVAETRRGFRAIETSHPPAYYFPPDDVDLSVLVPAARRTLCEWKGGAVYHDIVLGGRVCEDAAWSYPKPTADFLAAAGHIAFYVSRVDACHVDGERVVPQEGSFYGGWITSDIVGPFKGPPDTMGW